MRGGILVPPAILLVLNIKNPLPPRFLIKRDPTQLALHNLWKWRGWYNSFALGKLLQECVTKFGDNSLNPVTAQGVKMALSGSPTE